MIVRSRNVQQRNEYRLENRLLGYNEKSKLKNRWFEELVSEES